MNGLKVIPLFFRPPQLTSSLTLEPNQSLGFANPLKLRKFVSG
jgi:hypothetical protein